MSIVQLFNREQKAMDEFGKRNRDNMPLARRHSWRTLSSTLRRFSASPPSLDLLVRRKPHSSGGITPASHRLHYVRPALFRPIQISAKNSTFSIRDGRF